MTTGQNAPVSFHCPRCGGLMSSLLAVLFTGMQPIIIHLVVLRVSSKFLRMSLLTKLQRGSPGHN